MRNDGLSSEGTLRTPTRGSQSLSSGRGHPDPPVARPQGSRGTVIHPSICRHRAAGPLGTQPHTPGLCGPGGQTANKGWKQPQCIRGNEPTAELEPGRERAAQTPASPRGIRPGVPDITVTPPGAAQTQIEVSVTVTEGHSPPAGFSLALAGGDSPVDTG